MPDTKPAETLFKDGASVDQEEDAVATAPAPRVELTEEDNKRIRRKTDKVILSILVWVYFLQILDKSTLGYAAVFGMKTDTHLTAAQYSLISSIGPIAQVAWQPFSSWLIVKVPHRILMPALCLGWGIAQATMAACNDYQGLMATRFFLGLFEGGCLPLFSIITGQWYRRAEQPIRVAAWYGTNGIATVVAAALSYGLGHITSEAMRPWKIIFLFVGLLTIATVPFIYWKLDNDIPTARFLTEHEKEQAMERLRANQTGTGSREFKWAQVAELLMEPKSYLWFAITILLNTGSAVTTFFGPLILESFGFDSYKTSLLNIPFGAVQFILIMAGSWAAQKAKIKSACMIVIIIPVIVGLVLLYVLKRDASEEGPLLLAYYLLAFLFGGIPLSISWIVGNTGGTTKKSVIMSLYNLAAGAANVLGPLLFSDNEDPSYHKGLRSVMAIFIALMGVVLIQLANLILLNKINRKRRIRAGKKADIQDHSMEDRYVAADIGNADEDGHTVSLSAEQDLTDGKNDEFVYIY